MATKLLQLYDGTNTVNLFDPGAGYFQLRLGGWTSRTADVAGAFEKRGYGEGWKWEDYTHVTETFELVCTGSVTNIMDSAMAIERMLERARIWHNYKLGSPVLLRTQTASETDARQAIIYYGSLRYAGGSSRTPVIEGSSSATVLFATLTLMRAPLWEAAVLGYEVYGALSQNGGKVSTAYGVTGGAWGTVAGRIDSMSITASAATERIWCGIRELGTGTTDFDTVWELENGTIVDTTYTSLAGVSGASPSGSTNNCWLNTYNAADTSFTKRGTITCYQQLGSSADWSDMAGLYLVLMRVKIPSGTNVVFELRYGGAGSDDDDFQVAGTVYHQGTSDTYWQLVEFGNINIPPGGGRTRLVGSLDKICAATELQIWARRSAGTGNFYMDSLIMIPAQHILRLDDLDDMGATEGIVFASDGDEETWCSLSDYLTNHERMIEYSSQDLTMPVEGSIFVVAGESSTAHSLTNTLTITLYARPRFMGYGNTGDWSP